MPRFNAAYLNLNQNYLFAEIRRRTKVFTDAHPDVRLIDLGVGDVTQPLPDVTTSRWPSGWVCQAVRAPGSKVTRAAETRDGSAA